MRIHHDDFMKLVKQKLTMPWKVLPNR